MKRRFLAELCVLLLLLTAVSCGTASSSANEILRSSIDLATAYASAGNYEMAVDVYDRAYAQLEDYILLYNKAMTLAAWEKYDRAADVCVLGIRTFPSALTFRTALASFLEKQGKLEESCEALEQLLELDPYNDASRLKLVDLLTQLGETQRAAEHAQILWDQGIRTDAVVAVLYSADSEKWEVVYNVFFRGKEVPRVLPQESTQSDEPSSQTEHTESESQSLQES